MCRVRPNRSERFFDVEDPLAAPRRSRSGTASRVSPTSRSTAPRFEPWSRQIEPIWGRITFCSTSLSVPNWRTTSGACSGSDAPDRREVEVDREAVVGGELDPLARDVDRVVGRRLAQPVAARLAAAAAGSSPRPLLGLDHQGRLVVADADDVDPLLLGVEEVDAGLEDLLLDALGLARSAGRRSCWSPRRRSRAGSASGRPALRLTRVLGSTQASTSTILTS